MKLIILTCLMLTFAIVNINCKIYEVWYPKVLAEIFANRSKDFNESVEKQTHFVSGTIQDYMGGVEVQKNEMKKDLEKLIDHTANRVNDTFSGYIHSAKSIHKEVMNQVNQITTKPNHEYNPDVYLDTVQLARKYGYNAESHIVQTEDGYLLTVHRIPHGKGGFADNAERQAVLLQHGLLSSSADFVISGPEKGLAYILAEAGYDVWLGNFRGNTYSHAHAFLPSNSFEFWNFSWDEIAKYDLPAMIDYINKIKKTQGETIYIGHSMGTTTLFALLSTKPEYNEKLKAAFCLAPVAYMVALKSPIKKLAPFMNSIEWVIKNLGINEFLPQNEIMKWLSYDCSLNRIDEKICENVLFAVAGFDEKQFNKTILPVILGHSPAGASTKTMIHFGQEINANGKFQHFDYGEEKNIETYGQKKPPEYSVSNITLPIAFFSGDNDWLSDISDSRRFFKQLSNPIEFYEVPYKDFNHLDFLWASDAPTLVYKKLLQLMKEHRFSEVSWLFHPFSHFKFSGTIKYS